MTAHFLHSAILVFSGFLPLLSDIGLCVLIGNLGPPIGPIRPEQDFEESCNGVPLQSHVLSLSYRAGFSLMPLGSVKSMKPTLVSMSPESPDRLIVSYCGWKRTTK